MDRAHGLVLSHLVPEFDRQMGLGLGGLTGAAGWLLLPAQSVETIENLADLARLEPAALRVIEIRRHGLIEGSTICTVPGVSS